MAERHRSVLDRSGLVQRIEEHIEQWRLRDAEHRTEAEARRERLWAEAAERERLLAQAMSTEQSPAGSLEEITAAHRMVFVVHSEEVARTLEEFASEGERLVEVVPGRGGYAEGTGLKGSWLIFEHRD